MEQRIIEFVQGLRDSDIPVTLSETLDAVISLKYIPILDREIFQDALRSILVKKRAHQEEFDRLFLLYFSHLEQMHPADGKALEDETKIIPNQALEALLGGEAAEPSHLGQAILMGSGIALERMALEAAQQVALERIRFPLQVGFYTRRMMEQFDWTGAEKEIRSALAMLLAEGADPQWVERISAHARHNWEAFRQLLKRLVEREVAKNLNSAREKLLEESLLAKSFASLTDREIQQMQEVVARLVQRIRTRLVVREKKRRQGKLDIRRTLRKNLQYGGAPMELIFKQRKRKKTQIMALCDVSSSVWNASRFMLNLLYAIQDQFSKVRSFVFVSDLGEVTEFFSRQDVNEGIQRALKDAGINYFSYTDYGNVLARFHELHRGDVNGRTVLIIIGDGRNNFLPSNRWVLEELKDRAKQVIWLNPEPRSTWSLGDSVMHEYAPHCHMVRECRNLKQLASVIEEIIL